MTDQTAPMSADEAFGRALVARATFEKEAVWLPSLAVHHLNAGHTVIDGKTFTDCVIEGPAVIAAMGGVELDHCNMGQAANPRNLLLKPMGDKIVGAVGFSNSRFVRCTFVQVSFTGNDEALANFEAQLTIKSGDQPA